MRINSQPPASRKIQAVINVTPLVDVVLVLLIIFMVIAPELQAGPNVDLPTTEQPPQKADDGRQVRVTLEHSGTIWIDDDAVHPDEFSDAMIALATKRSDWKVVLRGDARLNFGAVRQAMLAVENAGFKDVGLIAEQRGEGLAPERD